MLLVVRTQTAIEWAALGWLHLSVPWKPRWQRRIVAIEPIPIAADKVLAHTVLWTSLAKVDAVPLGDDLGLHDPQTIRTQTLRAA
jgi:hypothetical protein